MRKITAASFRKIRKEAIQGASYVQNHDISVLIIFETELDSLGKCKSNVLIVFHFLIWNASLHTNESSLDSWEGTIEWRSLSMACFFPGGRLSFKETDKGTQLTIFDAIRQCPLGLCPSIPTTYTYRYMLYQGYSPS